MVQPAQVQRGALAVSEAAEEEVEARGRNRSRSRCVFDWCGRGNQLCAFCEDWVRGHSIDALEVANADLQDRLRLHRVFSEASQGPRAQ